MKIGHFYSAFILFALITINNYLDNLKNNKDINELKILLANEATKMLHGSKAAEDSEVTAKKTFKDKLKTVAGRVLNK